MKNQNDLICIVGCSLVAIIATVIMFFMKRDPVLPAAPQTVLTATPAYPTNANVTMSASLPGGGSSSGAGGFGGGFGGGFPGMGGRGGRGGPGMPGAGMVGPCGPPPGVGGPPPGIPGSAGNKRGLARG